MSEQYWDEIDGIGKLYLEEELVVGIEPVLVVCVDEVKNRYLIMTYDSYEGIYVYRKIEKIELLDMLENRVTMEETFRRGDKVYMTSMGEDGMLKSEGYPAADFDGGKLPDVGEYYEINSSYIQKYIKALRGYSIEKKKYDWYDCVGKMKISNENTLVDYTENSYTVQKSVQSRMRILLNQYGLNEMENSAA